MKNTKHLIAILTATSFLGACGKKKNNDNGPRNSGGNGVSIGRVTMKSTDLIPGFSQRASFAESTNCNFNMDIYAASGSCLTPLSYVGNASMVLLSYSQESNPSKGTARVAATLDPNSSEPGSILTKTIYDLSQSTKFIGYNELFLNYSAQFQWDYLELGNQFEMIKFLIKGKYVTMFVAAFQQPLKDWDIWSDCGVTSDQLVGSRYDDLPELSGMKFHRGDYLFCVKDTADATCAVTDFKWLDTSNNTLVSTRPTNPRTNRWLVNNKATCTRSGDRFSPSFTNIPFAGKLTQGFYLYADHSHGSMSNQWSSATTPFNSGAFSTNSTLVGQSPYSIYYYKQNASDTLTEGTQLDVDIDVDVSNSLYVDGLTSAQVDSATIDEILAKVYTKANWAFQKKAENNVVGYGVNQFAALSFTVTPTVSGGREPPETLLGQLKEQDAK